MVSHAREIRIGDHVRIPWGLDEVEAEVLDVQRSGLGTRLLVRLSGADEIAGQIVTVPADGVIRSDAAHTPEPDPRRYEAEVRAALQRLFPTATIQSQRPSGTDNRAEMQLQLGNHLAVIDVKRKSPRGRLTSDDVLAASGLASRKTSALLVSNVAMTPDANLRLTKFQQQGRRIFAVKWRGAEDDDRLRRSLKAALG